MVAEMIQLEEINWSLWEEERNCDAFIRAQSSIFSVAADSSYLRRTFIFEGLLYAFKEIGKKLSPFACTLALDFYSTNP